MPAAKPKGTIVYRLTEAVGSTDYTAAAKWRDSTGKQFYRRLGKAWVQPDDAGSFRKKRGTVPTGYLDSAAANRELHRLIDEQEAELHREPINRAATVADLAADFLDYAEHTKKVKPSTLKEWTRLLSEPRPLANGEGETDARIMRRFGQSLAANVTSKEVAEFLRDLDRQGLSARNVNIHRQVLSSMFAYATEPESLALRENPVSGTRQRPEKYDKPLETFTVEEVQAVARAATAGAHRVAQRSVDPTVVAEQKRADHQDGAMILVAAFTGLRQGELRALKWRNVRFVDKTLIVDAGLSANQESTTKSNKWRAVPLGQDAFAALDELSKRTTGTGRKPLFTGRDDYVFCGPRGEPLEASAIRRRYHAAREQAEAPKLPFHHLRHTFATLTIRALDPASVQAMMGHSKITTTERYMHSRSLADLADRLDAAFASGVASETVGVK